ncbi:MAG: hypothetical protein V1798_00945 [Pseudomonadota bacterium]
MTHRPLLPAVLFVCAFVAVGAAKADEVLPQLQIDARALSANPDSPSTGLVWRHNYRTKVSVAIPVVGADEKPRGFLLRLLPLLELHNPRGFDQDIPHRAWRGRVGFEGT